MVMPLAASLGNFFIKSFRRSTCSGVVEGVLSDLEIKTLKATSMKIKRISDKAENANSCNMSSNSLTSCLCTSVSRYSSCTSSITVTVFRPELMICCKGARMLAEKEESSQDNVSVWMLVKMDRSRGSRTASVTAVRHK